MGSTFHRELDRSIGINGNHLAGKGQIRAHRDENALDIGCDIDKGGSAYQHAITGLSGDFLGNGRSNIVGKPPIGGKPELIAGKRPDLQLCDFGLCQWTVPYLRIAELTVQRRLYTG